MTDHHFKGSLGAEHGPVPNLGSLVETAELSPAARDRLLGLQLERALGRDQIGARVQEAAKPNSEK